MIDEQVTEKNADVMPAFVNVEWKEGGSEMIRLFYFFTMLLSISTPVSAAIFTCNLQKVPPIGNVVDMTQYVKIFSYDSSKLGDTIENFEDLRLTLHAETERILVTISNSKISALTMVSPHEREIYIQLNDDAIGICIAKNTIKPVLLK